MPSGQGLTDGTAISLGDNANITIGTDFTAGGPMGTPTAVVEGNRVRDPSKEASRKSVPERWY